MLETPFDLPCGVRLPNRVAKAALSEQLGGATQGPDPRLLRLYRRWGTGGAGLLVTGNVMVDPAALGEPANVVVHDDRHLGALRRWADLSRAGGAVALVQVNHPGRQSPRSLSPRPVAPSAVGLSGMAGVFSTPRALSVAEIEELIAAYARTSEIVCRAGFDGVQIHAAHGYLVSQFLSPLANLRDDEYGGDAVRRRRFLLEIVAATRAEIGPDKVLSVKLNSADFQRGGFSEDESAQVAGALAAAGVDLLEISGGTYEKAAMMGVTRRTSTVAREAYFLEFAERLRRQVSLPLMVTGGFRTRGGMEAALESGAVDVIGLGRPFAVEPEIAARLLGEPDARIDTVTPKRVGPSWLGARKVDGMAETVWYTTQLWRIGRGQEPALRRSAAAGVGQYLLAGQLPAVSAAARRRAVAYVSRAHRKPAPPSRGTRDHRPAQR